MENNVVVSKKDFVYSISSVALILLTLTLIIFIESYKVGAIESLNYEAEMVITKNTIEPKDEEPEVLVMVEPEETNELEVVLAETEEVEVKEEPIEEKLAIHFNHANVLEVSHVTVEDLYSVLEGTALYDLAPIYVEAENLYGVNALFIVALTALESGWGTSDRAVYDNNLTGFGVYTDDSVGINATSKRENILMTTSWLKEAYLTEGGKYHNGFSVYSINIRYCLTETGEVNTHWSETITTIAYDLLSELQ